MTLPNAIRISLVAAALAGGSVLTAGCGGDTIGDNLFDASANINGGDATLPDAGMPDTGVVMTGAGDGAAACTNGTSSCGGVCVDTHGDRNNCGGCGTACASGQVCSAGSCQVSCGAGLVLCNGTCVDPRSNPKFCGATAGCGVGAGTPGTNCTQGQVCAGTGSCQTSCAANQVLCGTECIDPTTSNAACGAKGDCTTSDASNSPGAACTNGQICSNGVCSLTCAAGRAVCGGVCVDGQTDSTHCGATGDCTGTNAGMVCPVGQVCTGSSCAITCQTGQVQCGTDCVDPKTSLSFCGASGDCANDGKMGDSKGTACALGQVCNNGTCGTVCTSGLFNCSGICTNRQTDSQNCGTCGNICPGGTVCTNGSCTAQCNTGLSVCSNACVDEQNDPAHCGGCSACVTQTEVASTDCRAGVCAIGRCATGFADCDGTYTNGCESTRATDANNCGACGVVCASGVCAAGSCVPLSCADLHASNPAAGDGVYTIKPLLAAGSFSVYCDMTRGGGGWTLILKTLGGSTTFPYASALWTNAVTLNPNDTTLTAADAKYASFSTVPVAILRGELDGYLFAQTVTGAPTAMALFAGAARVVTPYPFIDPDPRFAPQANCQYFGIDTPFPSSQVRFGWTANNENNCTSNDTGIGFGLGWFGDQFSSGYIDGNAGGSAVYQAGNGFLWVK